MSKPFLKWAGGKFTQLSDLFQHIPSGLRLIEPFVGGGSVFLNSDRHANFLLADVNPDLINLYQMLAVVTRLSWWSAVSRPINVAQASLSQTL